MGITVVLKNEMLGIIYNKIYKYNKTLNLIKL
jgi:hypothetical protein